MLEIFLIIRLTRKIGDIVGEKGYSPQLFQIMSVVFWIGGELACGCIGMLLAHVAGLKVETGANLAVSYVCALFGALIGAAASFFIAVVLPAKASSRSPHYMDDYRDAREGRNKSRRRRSRDDDDERDRDCRRSRDRNDDDRDRRRSRDEDDRRRPRDEEDRDRRRSRDEEDRDRRRPPRRDEDEGERIRRRPDDRS